MKSNILLSLSVLIVTLFSFASNSFAAITVSAVPDNTNPAPGDSIHVLVNIDLTDEEDFLGEYTIEVIWDASILEYNDVSGGTSNGFTSLLSNTTNTSSGSLLITYINGNGTEGLVNVASIVFTAKDVNGAESNISLIVSSLSAANTFKDLLPSHIVQSGLVMINTPPFITTINLPGASESILYTVKIEMNDPDENDTHTYELVSGPAWMIIDTNTGVLSGTPGTDDVVNNVTITVKITDSSGLTDEKTYSIDVEGVNKAPIIEVDTLPSASVGVDYNTTIEVSDPDVGDSHTFELLESPGWMIINVNTGILDGTPGDEDVGTNIAVSIRVEDSAGLADTLFTHINVTTNYIILNEPEAEAVWSVGVEYEVIWVYSGITDVRIEFSINGGASWEVIEERTTASTGSYKWKVPDRESNNCVVKISDYADASVFHQSGIFTIRLPEIVIERIDPVLKAFQNDQIDFKVSVKSDTEISEVILHWDTTGERLFDNQLVMESSDGEIYSANLTEGTFTSDGIEYFIVARDTENHMTRLPDGNKHFCICAMVSGIVSKVPIPAGTAQTAYRMISVPLEFSFTSIAEQLSGRLPKGDKGPDWRLFRFSPGSDTPQEYPDINEIIYPGAAFWMIAKNGFTLEAPPGTRVTTEEPFKIELKPGWNDIANPWIFDISWNYISNPSNADLDGLFAYEGKWLAPNQQLIMKPWKGYTVRNMTNRPVIIFLQPESASIVGKTVSDVYQHGWELSISAHAGEAIDSENHLGVKIDALEEWDRYDHVEPPLIGEYVSIYFPHNDWEKYPYDYSMDFRPPDTEISWDFDVKTNIAQETVHVTLVGIEQLPEGYCVKIHDRDRDSEINIESSTFSFLSDKSLSQRHFRLSISNSPDHEPERNTHKPDLFVTAQCYPNPFNPQTVIQYTLSHPGRVSLSVFNSVGQRVQFHDIGSMNRGTHEFVFDASHLTAGLYLYRIDAGYFSVIQKMLYVK